MEKLLEILKSEYQLDDVQTRLLQLNCDIIKRLGFERILEKIEKDQRNRRDYMTELNLVGQLYRELCDAELSLRWCMKSPIEWGRQT